MKWRKIIPKRPIFPLESQPRIMKSSSVEKDEYYNSERRGKYCSQSEIDWVRINSMIANPDFKKNSGMSSYKLS